MEMILISTNKLKIILTKEEITSFDLTTDMLDYGNTETKRMLWDILSKAKRSVGFDPDGYRVFVQLFPSKDGACELFITKIVTSDTSIYDVFASEQTEYKEEYESDNEYDLYEDIGDKTTTVIFAMDSLDALSASCRRLLDTSFSGESSVYIFNGTFYLLLFFDQPYIYYPCDEFSFLIEYGTQIHSNELLMNVYEFGASICDKNAITKLAEL